jgi:hypothetical protein
MAKKIHLTQNELARRFEYNPETGALIDLSTKKEIGWGDDLGYRRASIDGNHYKVHRLIYKLYHGCEPNIIDHINRNPSDNRITNLRAATDKENSYNTKVYRNSKTGLRYITYRNEGRRKPYIVRISISGK